MAKPFPQNKLLAGIFEPWAAESNINDLIVVGEIPELCTAAVDIFFNSKPKNRKKGYKCKKFIFFFFS